MGIQEYKVWSKFIYLKLIYLSKIKICDHTTWNFLNNLYQITFNELKKTFKNEMTFKLLDVYI